jgi:hypothetical protein
MNYDTHEKIGLALYPQELLVPMNEHLRFIP